MNVKSLFLGSIAAVAVVPGVRAADAVVVAEPEPVEYVRVCDVYGMGFFYIPGTETCLKISGYIRFDVRAGDDPVGLGSTIDKKDALNGIANSNDTYRFDSRVALRFDARSDTELGTLRAYSELRFNYGNRNVAAFNVEGAVDGADINSAYIELGGLRVGKNDSLFSTFTNYAGNVNFDDSAVPYGPFDTHQIVYNFNAGNGFTVAVGVEAGGAADKAALLANYAIDSYVPDVVAGAAYKAKWGGISVVGGYDSVVEEGAVKARLDLNATDQLTLFIMGGYSTNDVAGRTLANNWYGTWSGDYAVWGGGTFKLNPKTSINAQISYDEDENFGAVANVQYDIVPGFRIQPELAYRENFAIGGSDSFGGLLRFQRNF